MKMYQRQCIIGILVSGCMLVGGCALDDACETDHQYRLSDDEHAAITADPELFKLYDKDSKGKLNWCQEFDAKHCSTEVRNGISVYKNCFETLPFVDARRGAECINLFGEEKGRYDFQCSAKQCSPLYHLESDPDDISGTVSICVLDSDSRCGEQGNCNEKDGIAENSGYCDHVAGDAVCKARSCADGFYLNSDSQCAPQTDQNCGPDGADNCIEIYRDEPHGHAACLNARCKLNCDGDYEEIGGSCVEKCDQNHGYYRVEGTTSCELRCNERQILENGECVNKCNPGFHLDRECMQNSLVTDNCCLPNNTVEHCGIGDLNCLADGAELVICLDPKHDTIPEPKMPNDRCLSPEALEETWIANIQSFKTESTDYENLKCSAARCDKEHNRIFIDVDADPKDATIDKPGYYFCESATIQRCGRDRISCKDDELFWSSGNCFVDSSGYGICVATECKTGGYLDLIKCKPYNASHCGVENTKCAENQFCDEDTGKCVEVCDEKKKNYNGVCYNPKTSIQYCGDQKELCVADHINKHEALKKCADGKCVLERCLFGYHKYYEELLNAWVCEEDTSEHCGERREKCQSGSGSVFTLPMTCNKETQQCEIAASVFDINLGDPSWQCSANGKDPVAPDPFEVDPLDPKP